MRKVTMMVGCPGSGKSTYAKRLVKEEGYLYLSLDGFRSLIWGAKDAFWDNIRADVPETKNILSHTYYEALDILLFTGVPKLVLDNTHVEKSHVDSHVEEIRDLIARRDYDLDLVVFQVPLQELLWRNSHRPLDDQVPETVVINCWYAHNSCAAWWRTYEPKTLIGSLDKVTSKE